MLALPPPQLLACDRALVWPGTVPLLLHLGGDSSPPRQRPRVRAHELSEGADSGQAAPTLPLDLPTPGTARRTSTPPRPPPRTGWLLSAPSGPSGPGKRDKAQMGTCCPFAPAESPDAELPRGTQTRGLTGVTGELVLPRGQQRSPYRKAQPGRQVFPFKDKNHI